MQRSWWQQRDWHFTADMNGDGVLAVADVPLWLHWLFFLPGDAIVAKVGPTTLGQILALTPQSFGGLTAALLSAAAWLAVFYLPRLIVDAADPTYRQRKREEREALARLRRERRPPPHKLWKRCA